MFSTGGIRKSPAPSACSPLCSCRYSAIIAPENIQCTGETGPWVGFRPLSDPITWRLLSSCPCSRAWWVLIRGWHLLTAAETKKGGWEGHFGDGARFLWASLHIKWGMFSFQMEYLIDIMRTRETQKKSHDKRLRFWHLFVVLYPPLLLANLAKKISFCFPIFPFFFRLAVWIMIIFYVSWHPTKKWRNAALL